MSLLDGVKHSDMRKVYVDLLCGGFTMLCAFFVYHDLGYKCSDDLGRERFDIDEFFRESYEMLYIKKVLVGENNSSKNIAVGASN